MKEICIVPTYRRTAYLWCALKRIRAQDKKLKIMVFSDRGEDSPELRHVVKEFNAGLRITPVHAYYGNSFCVMEAFRWAYDHGYEFIFYSEDDVMQKEDCLAWHREMHATFDDLFASCGWIFNTFAPITDDLGFVNWYYAPNAAFKREKLAKIVKHANPIYYNGMRDYVLKSFPDSILHNCGRQIETGFFEQDAIVQFCLMEDGSQVVWNGIAKAEHVGPSGYNKPDGLEFVGTLKERIEQVEALIADPYLRMSLFGRAIVEREIGRELPERIFRYSVTLPGEWSTEFQSELTLRALPKRINSVAIGPEAKIELL